MIDFRGGCLKPFPNPTESRAVLEPKEARIARTLHAWAIPQPKEGVISAFEYKEQEPAPPQPFSISQGMWEATQQNIAGLYIQFAKLNDKLEGKA